VYYQSLLTDAVSDGLNSNRVRCRFITTSFFLVDARAYSWSFWGFTGVATVNIFSSVSKMMLTSLDEYLQIFAATVLNG